MSRTLFNPNEVFYFTIEDRACYQKFKQRPEDKAMSCLFYYVRCAGMGVPIRCVHLGPDNAILSWPHLICRLSHTTQRFTLITSVPDHAEFDHKLMSLTDVPLEQAIDFICTTNY